MEDLLKALQTIVNEKLVADKSTHIRAENLFQQIRNEYEQLKTKVSEE